MTTVTFLTEGKRIIGFDAKGHSGYSEEGSDIVCAAASMLAFALAEAVQAAGLKTPPVIESGCGGFRLEVSADKREQARLDGMFESVKSIASEIVAYFQ